MRSTPRLLSLVAAVFVAACSSSPDDVEGGGEATNNPNPSGGESSGISPTPEHTALDDRELDYNEALRSASIKLLRDLPTLQQIKNVQNATDKKAAYEAELDAMFEDTRFAERMVKYWRDIMRQGGGANGDAPSRDTAPVFAARLVVEGRSYMDLFTATGNNCPSFDPDLKTFADGECNNNVPAHAGVLTNPGVQHQFYSNMAFRRVRWVQEVFVCTKFPAEYSDTPIQKGTADYVSPWPFESIATAPVDFQDYKSVVCANCHTSINHIAPLFGNFDMNGMWADGIQVMTPTTPDPIPTEISHWLQPGETTAWRLGQPVANLPELGQAMAADPAVSECAVARAWNFAFSKEDIVDALATVPVEVLEPYITEFEQSGHDYKELLRTIFKSEDFVRF